MWFLCVWFSVLAEAEASQDISDCSFFYITSNFVQTVCEAEDVSYQTSSIPLNAPRCIIAAYFKSVRVMNKVVVGVSFVRRA